MDDVENVIHAASVVADKVDNVRDLVEYYHRATGPFEPAQLSFSDLLADLILYARTQGWDFYELLAHGDHHAEAEWRGEF